MAEKTLPCSDLKEESNNTCSPALTSNDFEFPSITALIGLDPIIKELSEIRAKDPGYVQFTQELRRSQEGNTTEFNQEQFNNTMCQALRNPEIEKRSQRMRNHLLQNPRQLSLSLGSPEASEYFAERMARMKNDPEVKPILAEIDARGPAASIKFWDDEDVLKKLAKAATRGAVEGMSDEEQVSEGRKALDIACGYAKMKCVKVLLDAGVFDAGYRRKSTPRCAGKRGRKKRLQCKKGDAITSHNTESETPFDVATTSSRCVEAA